MLGIPACCLCRYGRIEGAIVQDKKRLLLCGPGLIGTQHARRIEARPDCVLAIVVAPRSDVNIAFAAQRGATLYSDIELALENEHIDAAIISSPNSFHFTQAMACIAKRVPVLIEKPMTGSIYDARRLAMAAAEHQAVVLVGHHRTYSPLLAAATNFLASPDFGQFVAFQGTALFYKPAEYFAAGAWRTVRGGGPILINLIHEIGLMRYFCGEIASVAALSSNKIRGFEVEDTVSVSLAFENGAIGNFLLSDSAASSKSWEMTAGENPAYPHFPNENCYHFAGTNGSLDFPSMRARTYGADTPSWWSDFKTTTLSFERGDPLEYQLAHFLDVANGNSTPCVTAHDGFMNMAVVEAIAASIQYGRTVNLSDLLEALQN